MWTLSEQDLELVDALQLNPRATWDQVGSAVGLSAVSAARRWRQLADSGSAWSGSTLGPALFRGGFIELACSPGSADAVATRLCERPDVITVGRSLGDFDVYAITVSTRLVPPCDEVLSDLAGLPVIRARTQIYTRVFGGPEWRLTILNRARQERRAVSSRGRTRATPGPRDAERRLFAALMADARRSHVELAAELGVSSQAIGRLVTRMQQRGHISFRADVARPLAGYPLAGLLWLTVPDSQVDDAGRWLATLPENRFCAHAVSAQNLIAIVNLHEPEQLSHIVQHFIAAFPDAAVAERRIITSLRKVHGRILDDNGRSLRMVTFDPWA
jgi:DNA-binding Lrp family transcriptional regulator